MLSTVEIVKALADQLIKLNGEPASIQSVSTDSRSIKSGELFVALRGERFDGHLFVDDVLQAGAAAVLVDQRWAAEHADRLHGLPLFIVVDTRQSFGALASAWRQRFSIPLIGVVGSNGKTTVKEMIASILAAEHGEIHRLATTGNLNNEIGVPTMLLRLQPAHHAAVIEIGMNHPGETAELAEYTRPTIGLINNAQREHQEFMKSVAAVADEHAALIAALPRSGVAVLNADDDFYAEWYARAEGRKTLSFGLNPKSDVTAVEINGGCFELQSPQGKVAITLSTLGTHNIRNALAAAAATLAAGCSLGAVSAGLAAFRPVKGRLQTYPGLQGSVVIDDTYNANPDSVRVAIDVLAAIPGRRVLVLGDMGEVGDQAGQYHDEVGGYAKSQGIDILLALGDTSVAATHNFGSGAQHFTQVEALVASLRPLLDKQTTVLVKGSRFMRMERVVTAITKNSEDQHAA